MNPVGFLQDAAGHNSSSRLLVFLGTLAVLVVWATVCIRTNTMAALPESVIALVTILVGNKLGTGFISERKSEEPKP